MMKNCDGENDSDTKTFAFPKDEEMTEDSTDSQGCNSVESDFNLLTCNSELVSRFNNPSAVIATTKYNPYFHQALFQGNLESTAESVYNHISTETTKWHLLESNVDYPFERNLNSNRFNEINDDESCASGLVNSVTNRKDSVQYCLNISNGKNVNLHNALDKMSLAYNPITKQLLFVSPKNPKNSELYLHSPGEGDYSRKQDDLSDEGNYSLSNCDKPESLSSGSPRSTLPRVGHQRDKDGGSFSSTISSLSDYSLSGSNASRDEDLIVENVTSENCFNDITPEKTTKLKKKTLTNFFSRGVFNWKSGEGNHDPKAKSDTADKTPSWRIFRTNQYSQEMRLTPPCAGSLPNTEPHLSHRRQGSSTSEKNFEDIIASSTALIQHERPAGLPAKDAGEADRHAAEVAILVAAARRRAAEATARGAEKAAARRKREAQRDAALTTWRAALGDWDAMKSTRQIHELWWNGLPPPVRGKVWQRAISNHLNITNELYDLCVKEAKKRLGDARQRRIAMKINFHEDISANMREVSNRMKANDNSHCKCIQQQDELNRSFKVISERDKHNLLHRNNSEKNFNSQCHVKDKNLNGSKSNPDLYELGSECGMELIELDIARTFPNLCIFQPGGPYFDVLHEVLAAYVCYRPDIGYVQGMSFIAAILILNMDAPAAFTCFANLLNGPILRAAFMRDETAVQRIWAAYTSLLVDQLPSLSETSAELAPELYLLEWLYTAFAKAMPLDAACRVWDVFIRDGDEFLLRTALGILHMYQDEIVKMDFITAAQFLTKLPEDMCVDTLFKSISSINMNIGKKNFQDLIASYNGKSAISLNETDTVVRL